MLFIHVYNAMHFVVFYYVGQKYIYLAVEINYLRMFNFLFTLSHHSNTVMH